MDQMHGGEQKWREITKRTAFWDSSKARIVQRQEARQIIKWLEALPQKRYQILELGCGNGYVGKLIIDYLTKGNHQFTYQLTDLLSECLALTKKNLRNLVRLPNVKISKVDVYELDKLFKPRSQHIVISTGYAAAATYKQVVPKVAAILRPKGYLICDFINHLSPVVLAPNFLYALRLFTNLRNDSSNPNSKRYHVGRFGIRQFFREYDLEMIHMKGLGWKRNPLVALFQKRQK